MRTDHRLRTPIIVVPAAATSVITTWNVKEFLEDYKLVSVKKYFCMCVYVYVLGVERCTGKEFYELVCLVPGVHVHCSTWKQLLAWDWN